MLLETFPVGPLGCNCTILADEATKDAIVVDPGGDAEEILARLNRRGLRVGAIVHTHTHIDHVGATEPVQRATGAPARIHEGDLFLYDMLPIQGQLIGIRTPARAELDTFLQDGEVVTAGPLALEVIHTPGHTPGSVCFYCRHGGQDLLFAGDTLFAGSIGRTDLWGGDHDAILRSIKRRLLTLPGETQVIPGHDGATTIDREAHTNPFLR
jgi:glyoxylase-like metal-dependent hydrolase (beta-lactamase superfamily II)